MGASSRMPASGGGSSSSRSQPDEFDQTHENNSEHEARAEGGGGKATTTEEEEEEEEEEDEEECHLLIRMNDRLELSEQFDAGAMDTARASEASSAVAAGVMSTPSGAKRLRQSTGGSLFGSFLRTMTRRRSADSDTDTQNSAGMHLGSGKLSVWPIGALESANGAKRTKSRPTLPGPPTTWSDSYNTLTFGARDQITCRRSNESSPVTIKHLLFLVVLIICLLISSLMFLAKLVSLVQDQHDRYHNFNMAPPPPPPAVSSQTTQRPELRQLADDSGRWLVSTAKCRIPALDAWDESIRGYVHREKPIDCSAVVEKYRQEKLSESHDDDEKDASEQKEKLIMTETLTYSYDGKLYFTAEALDKYENLAELCCFRPISRRPESDDYLDYGENCTNITTDGIRIHVSLIEVQCEKLNYKNVHRFFPHYQSDSRLHSNQSAADSIGGERDAEEDEEALQRVAADKLDGDNYYNVLMLGIDTMSRLNAIRQLNKTLQLMRDSYKALDFVGYNKVGENTFPNLIPLLTGLAAKQLAQTDCWLAKGYSDESERGDDYLDNCKYLWNFYQQLGYVTYFNEDWPSASTFNYLKPGFKYEPTNHYGRPFTLARRELLFPKFKSMGCATCQLDRPVVQVDLSDLQHFLESHKKVPYFAFHWINCPQHDDLNGASQFDAILRDFFKKIHKLTNLDRTFVFLFSDHGYRWNDFVSTRIGHYESSLPMMKISPPVRFLQRHPELYETLREHQKSLITPFDMFKTLIDIRNLGMKSSNSSDIMEKSDARSKRAANEEARVRRAALNTFPDYDANSSTPIPVASTTIKQIATLDGLSFKQNFNSISLLQRHNATQLDRSCIEAGIPDYYCVCHQFEKIATKELDVLGAAYHLVYVHMQRTIGNHRDLCHSLDLESIKEAEMFEFAKAKTSESSRAKRTADSQAPKIHHNHRPTTTQRPAASRLDNNKMDDTEVNLEGRGLFPKREYNILLSTKPGGGLFQEVVRFYGDNLEDCKREADRSRMIVEDQWANFDDKLDSVRQMSKVCRFSVHSDSISRLNLYKDQSRCVKSNIELKKMCYCRDLRT